MAGLRIFPSGQVFGPVVAATLWQRPVLGLRTWSDLQGFFIGRCLIFITAVGDLIEKIASWTGFWYLTFYLIATLGGGI